MQDIFSKEDLKIISQSIANAEALSSGEIRVHIEKLCPKDPLDRAKKVFAKLQMHKTQQRNAVLIYLSIKDRKIAIFGDKAIHEILGNNFWINIITEMKQKFSQEKYLDGILEAIKSIGLILKDKFSAQTNNLNELDNEVSFE